MPLARGAVVVLCDRDSFFGVANLIAGVGKSDRRSKLVCLHKFAKIVARHLFRAGAGKSDFRSKPAFFVVRMRLQASSIAIQPHLRRWQI
jgi:hypothetical protein